MLQEEWRVAQVFGTENVMGILSFILYLHDPNHAGLHTCSTGYSWDTFVLLLLATKFLSSQHDHSAGPQKATALPTRLYLHSKSCIQTMCPSPAS